MEILIETSSYYNGEENIINGKMILDLDTGEILSFGKELPDDNMNYDYTKLYVGGSEIHITDCNFIDEETLMEIRTAKGYSFTCGKCNQDICVCDENTSGRMELID